MSTYVVDSDDEDRLIVSRGGLTPLVVLFDFVGDGDERRNGKSSSFFSDESGNIGNRVGASVTSFGEEETLSGN
jgi:hypothetical protein